MRRLSTLAVLAVAAALFGAAALAKTPIPAESAGTGSEPTAGGGVIAGAPFAARYAEAVLDISFDQLEVFLFPTPVACNAIAFAAGPYVEVIVDTNAKPLLLGHPALENGVAFVQVDFHPASGTKFYSIQPGTSIVFSRIDPAKNGLWHGKLTVSRQRSVGKVFSYAGTFAAHWCGKD
jgi:hypothetical protein